MAAPDCYLAVINAGFGAVFYVVEYVDYVAGGQKMVCQVMWRGNARNGRWLMMDSENTVKYLQNFKPFTNFQN